MGSRRRTTSFWVTDILSDARVFRPSRCGLSLRALKAHQSRPPRAGFTIASLDVRLHLVENEMIIWARSRVHRRWDDFRRLFVPSIDTISPLKQDMFVPVIRGLVATRRAPSVDGRPANITERCWQWLFFLNIGRHRRNGGLRLLFIDFDKPDLWSLFKHSNGGPRLMRHSGLARIVAGGGGSATNGSIQDHRDP